MINREELEGYVDAGIALLDKECAFDNWREKIDLGELRMSLSDKCILGQIYGSFGTGCADMNIPLPYQYGFARQIIKLEPGAKHPHAGPYYKELNKIWREKLS